MAKFFFQFLIIFFVSLNFSMSNEINNIEINAKQFTHDRDNKRIFAVGNVEVIDKKFRIFAEEIFYNVEKKIIS